MLARRSSPPELWDSAALGGQPSAVLEATAQACETGSPETSRPDSVDVASPADLCDERRPGLTQSEEERMDCLFSPGQDDDEEARPRALQTVRGLAASIEVAQTAPLEEIDLSTALLLRGSFDPQAHWHTAVAHTALVAKGHACIVQGSCFDPGCRNPRAPQCERCSTTFAISKVHALAKSEGSCLPVAGVAQPPLVQPQRLLTRCVYRLGVFPCTSLTRLGNFAAGSGVTRVRPPWPSRVPSPPPFARSAPTGLSRALISGTSSGSPKVSCHRGGGGSPTGPRGRISP